MLRNGAKGRQWIVLLVLVSLTVAAVRDSSGLGNRLPWRQMSDFSDFYCAGAALNRGRSPYTYEPLHSCEQRIGALIFVRQNPTLVIPAPQPPYDFLPFALLARLPFPAALTLYTAAIVLLILGAAAGLTLLRIPWVLAVAAFAIPAIYVEMAAGQVVPFSLLFLVAAAAALRFQRYVLAGVMAALVAVEPQLGVPVAVTVFLYAKEARLALAATAIALALAGCWVVTPAGFWDYLSRTLPAHAGSESAWPFQYSLTYALHFFGVPAGIAQIVGTLSFVATFAIAVWASPRLAAALKRSELLVFFPAMAVVLGGPFIHNVEIPAAVPAAIILAIEMRGTSRIVSGVALCAIVLPWLQLWGTKRLFAASILTCAIVLFRLGFSLPMVLGTLIAFAAIIFALERNPPPAAPASERVAFNAADLASRAWQRITPTFHYQGLEWLLVKMPTWVGLLAVLIVAIVFLVKARASLRGSAFRT